MNDMTYRMHSIKTHSHKLHVNSHNFLGYHYFLVQKKHDDDNVIGWLFYARCACTNGLLLLLLYELSGNNREESG